MSAETILLVYMTAGSKDEARSIGRALVASGLAACVNILDGMTSIYAWEGALQEEREVVFIAKTTAERFAALEEKVSAMHSYDCPCIVTLPTDGGNRDFLDWIAKQVDGRSTGDD